MWQYIIGMAAFEPIKTIELGRLIDLKPGQFIFRGPQLADRLHIDRNKIYRLIALFEQDGMINVQKVGNRYSIISVKNYSVYQGDYVPIEKNRETNEIPKPMESCGFEVLSLQQSENQIRNKRETIYKKDNKVKNEKINICASHFEEIISYLNQKAETEYRATSKSNQQHIIARLNEGYSIDDFKKVIDNMVAEWGHEPAKGQKDMRIYLRPETLFGSKFDSYLNVKPSRRPVEKRNNFEQRHYDSSFYDRIDQLAFAKKVKDC